MNNIQSTMFTSKLTNVLCVLIFTSALSSCASTNLSDANQTQVKGSSAAQQKKADLTFVDSVAKAGEYLYTEKEGEEAVRVYFPPTLSTAEQNSKAIEALSSQGLETEESDKGVVIYLPPSIYFDGASSRIDIDARKKIADIAKEVNKQYLVNRNIEVEGHSDSQGDEASNMRLSQKRALAASEELIFSRVDSDRLSTVWKGESELRFEEQDENGVVIPQNRNRNRRVEFTILN